MTGWPTAAAAPDSSIITQLGANVPLVVGILVFVGGILALIVVKPPSYKEISDENTELRRQRGALEGRVDGLEEDLRTFKRRHDRERDVLGAGFDALYRINERQREHWGDADLPFMDAVDTAAVKAARDLRLDAAAQIGAAT